MSKTFSYGGVVEILGIALIDVKITLSISFTDGEFLFLSPVDRGSLFSGISILVVGNDLIAIFTISLIIFSIFTLFSLFLGYGFVTFDDVALLS